VAAWTHRSCRASISRWSSAGAEPIRLPIPLTVLTGYLGSGKTTLLKALLADPAMAGTAVIVNEFGEVGLDDQLIAAASEETILLPSGCVCCAVRGDLVAALTRLHEDVLAGRVPELRRAVLETTGLADPAPIVHTLMSEREIFRVWRLDGIVTTVDAEHGLSQLERAFEPAKQIALADRIVITKTDRAPVTTALEERIGALNPGAVMLKAIRGAILPAALIGLDAHEIRPDRRDISRWLAADSFTAADHQGHVHGAHDHACDGAACAHPDHGHDHAHGHLHGVTSFCLTFEKPLAARQLEFAIELLRETHGDRLLRVKGILDIEGQERPFVIHGVQHVFYPPEQLERWPGADRRSRIVFITRDLAEATVRTVFAPLIDGAGAAR